MDELNEQFFAIANDLAAQEANDYLDRRLAALDEWVAGREADDEPADLRSLILQVMHEPNKRGPVIVALCAAMWRLREMEKTNAHQ